MYNRTDVDYLKKKYPKGTVVRLVSMDDKQAPPSGTEGVVQFVDDIGTVHVKWGNGSSLGLIEGEDNFTILSYPKIKP